MWVHLKKTTEKVILSLNFSQVKVVGPGPSL